MNTEVMFLEMNKNELYDIYAGDWFGAELIEAIFEIGRTMGNAIGDVIWG
ncbi:MAG: hypothetical protein J6I97_07945 [Agathobacter sp.]|nr:hypothetical protein [Agathobacter sp.]